jgi:hypothetical protein
VASLKSQEDGSSLLEERFLFLKAPGRAAASGPVFENIHIFVCNQAKVAKFSTVGSVGAGNRRRAWRCFGENLLGGGRKIVHVAEKCHRLPNLLHS